MRCPVFTISTFIWQSFVSIDEHYIAIYLLNGSVALKEPMMDIVSMAMRVFYDEGEGLRYPQQPKERNLIRVTVRSPRVCNSYKRILFSWSNPTVMYYFFFTKAHGTI